MTISTVRSRPYADGFSSASGQDWCFGDAPQEGIAVAKINNPGAGIVSPALTFRSLPPYTLDPVQPKEAAGFIRDLRSFLNATRLRKVIDAYKGEIEIAHDIQCLRLQERQPLLEAFIEFDKATLGGRRMLKRLSSPLAELANVAGMAKAITPSLSEKSKNQHRECLLSLRGQLKPLLLEWKCALQLARRGGAALAWIPSGEQSAPEFVARVDGIEFDVECKRSTAMVLQRLGAAEADLLASTVMQHALDHELQGDLVLEVPDSLISLNGSLNESFGGEFKQHVHAGTIDVTLPNGARLSGRLEKRTANLMDLNQWWIDVRRVQHSLHNARGYSNASNAGGKVVSNPLTLMLTAPTKNPDDLSRDLWERKFKKAATQCSGKRGAILVFEWEFITDPYIFADASIFRHMTATTFAEYPYVARIIMRCDNAPERVNGEIAYNAKAYTVENEETTFPDVRRFMGVEAPL